MFPNPKMVAFFLMCIQSNNQITKTFAVAQLPEHQSKKLIPASKMLNILVAIILLYDTEKLVVVQKLNHLGENVFVFIHIQPKLRLQSYDFKSLRKKISCNKL